MRVLTLGGGFVAEHLPYEIRNSQLYVNPEHMDYILSSRKPNVVVNCVGKTGRPNIDWCETNKSATYESNVIIPMIIADWCAKNGAHLIHLGSGCIFSGTSPNTHRQQTEQGKRHTKKSEEAEGDWITVDDGWQETDVANPQSYYSKSKYACDLMLGEMPHVTTLRLRMPLSEKDHPRNLINKLRGYTQVIDIPNSMTFMDDLVRCIAWAATNRPGGTFHVANPQPLTAARIMNEFQKYVPEHQFELISEQQLDQLTVAKRSNCLLSTKKLSAAGFEMTDSEKALAKCMANYVKNMRRNNVE
jgi:dTDP-4-dehydrorhamnose reductase